MQAEAVGPCHATDAGALRIAVLYRNSRTGTRQRDGAREACAEFEAGDPQLPVLLEGLAYTDEEDGFFQLQQMVRPGEEREPPFHIVLGPTDSGVFVNAIQRLPMPEGSETPVISPTVTAQVGNEQGGWYFRTNVDVRRRAQKIYDVLDQDGHEHLAVLYADTAFGRRAQEAFSRELTEAQHERYVSVHYPEDLEGIRGALRTLLERRPGAVGIFGPRHHIRRIAEDLDGMDAGWSAFRPLLFTVLDTRTIDRDGIRFVSLVGPSQRREEDEVRGLAYDTMQLVLRVASEAGGIGARESVEGREKARSRFVRRFRRRFAGILAGPPGKPGAKTGLRFDRFENQATPHVYHLDTAKVIASEPPSPPLWLSKLTRWREILWRRFGLAPLWTLLIVAVGTAIVSWVDLRRSRHVSRRVVIRPSFLALVGINVLLAMGAFCLAAWLEWFRWDNVLAAVAMPFTYAFVLRTNLTTTLFPGEGSAAIGWARVYDYLIGRIRSRVMLARFEREGRAVNFIAYTNTYYYLRQKLEEVFESDEGPHADQLRRELEAEIETAASGMARRRVCAYWILDMFREDWRALQTRNIVPHSRRADELFDPRAAVQLGADYCLHKESPTPEELKDAVEEQIEQASTPSHREELERQLEAELANATTTRGRYAARLHWLFIQRGFRTDELVKDGFLPPDFEWRLREGVTSFVDIPPEHRGSPRRKLSGHVRFRPLVDASQGERPPFEVARLENVSDGGACLIVERDTAVEPPARVELELCNGGSDPLTTQATVVHVRPRREDRSLGLAWVSPDAALRAWLRDVTSAEPRAEA